MKINALRPHGRDLSIALGDLEAAVLRHVWEAPAPLSVKELHARISKSRPVAVTTVATILDRLYRKGLVARELVSEGGPHYLYKPKVTENEFRQVLVDNVMGSLLRNFNEVTISYLAEKMSATEGDKKIISKYLTRLRKGPRK